MNRTYFCIAADRNSILNREIQQNAEIYRINKTRTLAFPKYGKIENASANGISTHCGCALLFLQRLNQLLRKEVFGRQSTFYGSRDGNDENGSMSTHVSDG